MVCILLALPNITFFLMFSAHKPLQSIYFLGFRSSHDVGWWCTCARMCFCYLSSHWWFILLAPYFFILGFLSFCLLLSNLNPWNSLIGATVPGIDQTSSFLMCCSHIINSMISGFPDIWFWCTSLSPDPVYRSVLHNSTIYFTFRKFFLINLF